MTPIFDELVDDFEDSYKYFARFTTCHRCRGYGIVNGYENDVRDCWPCGGGGLELARDDQGRFTNLWATDEYKVERDFLQWLRGPHYATGGLLKPGQVRISLEPREIVITPAMMETWKEVTGFSDLTFKW